MPVNDAISLAEKKAAKAAYDREYRAKNAEKIKAAKAAWGKTEVKKAYDKKWVENNRERSNAIKRAWKERNPGHQADYYAKNAERIKEQNRTRTQLNPELNRARSAEWKAANPEKAREAYRRCYQSRRADYIVRARARKTKITLATPLWADKKAIDEMYAKAAKQGLHVDHIIPLNGRFVTGLHTLQNLQLLTPEENLRKGNRYAS